MAHGTCKVPGCGRAGPLSHGWCGRCYQRWRRTGDPERVERIWGDLSARFESKVDRSGGPDACHPWRGPLDKKGYGNIRVNGKRRRVHQVAWELANGEPVPDGHDIDHSCRNEAVRAGTCRPGACAHRRCCNPHHLRALTRREHADVTEFCWERPRGSALPWAKLTEDQVREIKRQLTDDKTEESDAEIARRCGVSAMTIWRIRRGASWAWLE